jgi:hypothetical protein
MIDRVCLLAGPPFGAALFRAVEPRLRAALPGVQVESRAVPAAATGVGAQLDLGGTLTFAHGLAVPAAVHAAVPPRALVVANGPVTRLDPVTRLLSGLAASPVGAAALLGLERPGPWLWWLRSSAGLRRAVANPYAMDRDSVAALCGPVVATATARRALADYLRWLPAALPLPAPRCPAWSLWGTDDVLYPASEAEVFDVMVGGGRRRDLAGGRFVFPEELPWALADGLAEIYGVAAGAGVADVSATPVSRSRGRGPLAYAEGRGNV